MDLYWLGHASFRLRSGNSSLIMDPLSGGTGLRMPAQHTQAGVVTLSGAGADGDSTGDVRPAQDDRPPVVLKGPGEYEAAGLHIRGVRSVRVGSSEEMPLWNTMFVIESEGVSVCHLGDPAHLLVAREAEELSSPHVLLLPVGSKTGL
ncbi:MAG: MBL fold metallo-hydrolase, partial [Dehalococcoidia bacterium]